MAIVQIVFVLFVFFVMGECLRFNVTVSTDGSGNFKTIKEAVAAAPDYSHIRFFIRLKAGTYVEHVEVPSSKTYLTIFGDDASNTIIVDNRSNSTGFGTTDSSTFVVNPSHFVAQSITFQNSAGPSGGPAVALTNNGNWTTFYRCVFVGFQDTLFLNGYYFFFKESDIYGTVDFIFGGASAIFQDCMVYAQLPNTTITVTAQSKTEESQPSGFVFQNCSVMASPKFESSKRLNFEVYLGRPWRDYSTVIFMESYLDYVVNPAGWSAWPPMSLNLLYYAEYQNRGPGADLSQRIKWPGFHVINSLEASKFTLKNFIDGASWLPETGVPFRPDLA